MRSAPLAIAFLMVMAAVTAVCPADESEAYGDDGTAFWSTTQSAAGRVTRTMSFINGTTQTMYFCSPSIAASGSAISNVSDPLNTNFYAVRAATHTTTFSYNGLTYDVDRYTIEMKAAVASNTITVISDGSLFASHYDSTLTFDIVNPSISTSVSPTGTGSVSPALTSSTSYAPGDAISLTASAYSGNVFKRWMVNGAQVSTSSTYSYTVDSTATISIVAEFDTATYSLTTGVAVSGTGSVSPQYNNTQVAYGAQVTLTATPASGYAFSNWIVGGGSTGAGEPVKTFTITSDITILASFTALPTYTVTFDAAGGTVSPSSAVTGTDGRLASLPTPTRSGYTFQGWYTGTNGTGSPVTTSYVFSSDRTIHAYWTQEGADEYLITFEYNIPGAGTATASPSTAPINGRSTLTATPASGYHFIRWEFNAPYASQTSNPYTATMGSAMLTGSEFRIRAVFGQDSCTVTTYAPAGGTISPTYSGTSMSIGTAITLTATPASGYTFDSWKITSSLTHVTTTVGGNPLSYTVNATDGDVTISADFRLIATYTITFDANGGTPATTTRTTDESGRVQPLPTVARDGYTLDGWFTERTGGTQITAMTVFDEDTVVYAHWTHGGVYWSNGHQNGRISIGFSYENANVWTHTMTIPLKTIPIASDAITDSDFTDTGYKLMIEASMGNLTATVKATLKGPDGNAVAAATKGIGNWRTFVIDIDTINSIVSYGGINKTALTDSINFQDFNSYSTEPLLDYSSRLSMTAFDVIVHTESAATETDAAHPSFSVIDTSVWMNTYGVVMKDPSMDIETYFPNYDALRLNLYAFAILGESITINGVELELDGSKVTIPCSDISQDGKQAIYSPNGQKAMTKTLTNIYVTYAADGKCYLTFADSGATVDMGAYEGMEISARGVWFFTTGLYHPYTAQETIYSFDWQNTLGQNGTLAIFLAVLIAGFAGARVKGYEFTIIDYLVIGGAAVVAMAMMM